MCIRDRDYSSGEPLEIFDPENTWKKMTLCDYEVSPMLAPIFENGALVYTLPTLCLLYTSRCVEETTTHGRAFLHASAFPGERQLKLS